MFSFMMIFVLMNGLFYPLIASGIGIFYITSRIFYASGYAKKGPAGRKPGAMMGAVSIL